MSYRVFFSLSSGLKEPITVPKGTLNEIAERVKLTEQTLGFEVEQYRDNPKHWRNTNPKDGVSDEVFCKVAEAHNKFVRWLYYRIEDCSKKSAIDGEVITPSDIAPYWYGLDLIEVPAHRWTGDYYRARMEALYEVMRGRECEGMVFDSDSLTPRQAACVINLFSQYLDQEDLRLDVPKDRDYLASSADGGYEWCERCGAVTPEHAEFCEEEGCPLRSESAPDDEES